MCQFVYYDLAPVSHTHTHTHTHPAVGGVWSRPPLDLLLNDIKMEEKKEEEEEEEESGNVGSKSSRLCFLYLLKLWHLMKSEPHYCQQNGGRTVSIHPIAVMYSLSLSLSLSLCKECKLQLPIEKMLSAAAVDLYFDIQQTTKVQ